MSNKIYYNKSNERLTINSGSIELSGNIIYNGNLDISGSMNNVFFKKDNSNNLLVGKKNRLNYDSNYFGENNTIIGLYNLENFTDGERNTIVGFDNLIALVDGNYNVMLGSTNFYYMTNGGRNIVVGNFNGYNLIEGDDNIIIGTNNINSNNINTYNIIIGNHNNSSNTNTNNDNVIIIGNNINSDSSNCVILGNDDIQKTILKGNVVPGENDDYSLGTNEVYWNSIYVKKIYTDEIYYSNDTSSNTWIKFVNNEGNYHIKIKGYEFNNTGVIKEGYLYAFNPATMAHIVSDDRLKHNEQNIINSLDLMRKLQPQTYDMTQDFKDADFSGTISGQYTHKAGFIAQEIRAIEEISYCCVGEEYDSSGNPTSLAIDYNSIFTHGISAIKELHSIVESLQSENTLLKNKLNEVLTEMGKDPI